MLLLFFLHTAGKERRNVGEVAVYRRVLTAPSQRNYISVAE